MGKYNKIEIGTRKCRTPYQTQHTKCGEITSITICIISKIDECYSRFLLNRTKIIKECPYIPCEGHYSDHYCVSRGDIIVMNCAAAQTSAFEFMTDKLKEPQDTMWNMLIDNRIKPYEFINNMLNEE